jgi:hypothetical protein
METTYPDYTKVLIENDFSDDLIIHNDDGTIFAIGNKGRFSKGEYHIYQLRIENDKIVSEMVHNKRSFKTLIAAQNFFN